MPRGSSSEVKRPFATLLRRDDELDRRRPVGVQDDHSVVVEGVEHLLTQLLEARHQCGVFAVVQLPPSGLRQHDRRDVRNQTRAHHLAHDHVPFAVYRLSNA